MFLVAHLAQQANSHGSDLLDRAEKASLKLRGIFVLLALDLLPEAPITKSMIALRN